jgi:hypothetical protein
LFRGGRRIQVIRSTTVYRTRELFGTFDQVEAGAAEKHSNET